MKRLPITSILFLVTIIGCNKVKINENEELAITDFNIENTINKSKILNYLDFVQNQNLLLVGQNIGHADGSLEYGQYDNLVIKPSILGVDLGYDDLDVQDDYLLDVLKSHWNEGGLITLSTHMPNPFNLKPIDNKNKVNLNELYGSQTKAKERFDQMLINLGNFIQLLKNEEIVVLLRPFHEMNGGWFWWGNDKEWPEQNDFIAMWKYVHEYLENDRQLDNILWVYSPNFQESAEQKSVIYYYPGDNYVDIVALDYYSDNLDQINQNQSLDLLKTLNKPIGIAEIGSKSIRDGSFDNLNYLGLKNLEGISYFLVWHSYPKNKVSLFDNLNHQQLLSDSSIISLDEINF